MTIRKAIKFSIRPRRVRLAEFYSTIDRGRPSDFQEINGTERWCVRRDGQRSTPTSTMDGLLDNVLVSQQFLVLDEERSEAQCHLL